MLKAATPWIQAVIYCIRRRRCVCSGAPWRLWARTCTAAAVVQGGKQPAGVRGRRRTHADARERTRTHCTPHTTRTTAPTTTGYIMPPATVRGEGGRERAATPLPPPPAPLQPTPRGPQRPRRPIGGAPGARLRPLISSRPRTRPAPSRPPRHPAPSATCRVRRPLLLHLPGDL